jgi:pectate lyase
MSARAEHRALADKAVRAPGNGVKARALSGNSLLGLAATLALLTLPLLAQDQKPVQPTPGQVPPLPPRLPEGIPAFPGAWGGGMFTTGGRGGKVIEVTNLHDSGPGSLRAAIETPGPRMVVFRVAGIIELKSGLNIVHPDITIAGQSAPGDGICLSHDSLNINTRNVIIRHLRVRRGQPEGGQGSDNIGGNPEGQIIVDHCSASWGMDENLSLYRYMKPLSGGGEVKLPAMNVTVQWCISSEALNAKNHAFGGTWGGQDSTFHHNLFACNTGRNPSIGMSGEFDYRNNVIFNWNHRTMDGGDETSLINVINNYYKPGPATNPDMRSTIARIEQRNMYSPGRAFEPGNWYPRTEGRPGKWYVAGNIFEGFPEVTANNWRGMRGPEELARVNTPFEGWPVNQQTALEAYEAVLAKAGATLPRRDAVDRRVTESVRTGKMLTTDGIVKDPKEVGGYPNYTFSPADVPADTDHDGMPDSWEKTHNLNPADATDGPADADKDGYTNVEEFLNSTNPRELIDYRNLGNNVDRISG